MDQTSPDQATPERSVETEGTPPVSAPDPAGAPSNRTRRIETRLQAKVGGGEIAAWTRSWVSRSTRLHRLLAARTLDFAVLSDDRLTLVSTGFFTRRPRRRVYATELRELAIVDDPVPKGRRLRLDSPVGHELWMELGEDERSIAFADALVARTRRARG
jgi:hypothetical protein